LRFSYKSMDKLSSLIYNLGTLSTLTDNHICFWISFHTWSNLSYYTTNYKYLLEVRTTLDITYHISGLPIQKICLYSNAISSTSMKQAYFLWQPSFLQYISMTVIQQSGYLVFYNGNTPIQLSLLVRLIKFEPKFLLTFFFIFILFSTLFSKARVRV